MSYQITEFIYLHIMHKTYANQFITYNEIGRYFDL